MTVGEIFAAFDAAARAGRLTGDSPPGLAQLLATLAVAELPIQGGQAGEDAQSAWLTASATYLNTAWRLRLTGRPAEDPALCALEMRMDAAPTGTPWTFAQAFPAAALPPSRRPAEDPGLGITLRESIIAPMVLQQPALLTANAPGGTAPLPRLQGWLVLTGSALEPYIPFLGADRLWTDGTVDMGAAAVPRLALYGAAPGLSIDMGRLSLDSAGVELRNDYPDPFPLPAEGSPTSAALLYGILTVPTTPVQTAILSAPLLNGDYVWPLYTEFQPPITLRSGAALLAWLVAGDASGRFALPPGIPGLDWFGIDQVMFGVVPPEDMLGLPSLASTSVQIVSQRPWNPPVPYLMIDEVGVQWTFTWSDPLLVTAAVFGTMSFGAKKGGSVGAQEPPPVGAGTGVKLHVRMELPDQYFFAYTEGEIELPLSSGILAYFDAVPPDTPSLTIRSISAEASLLRQTYSGTLSVTGRWPVTAGGVTFNLDNLEFWVSVNQGTVSGAVQGITSVAVPGENPALLLISARYPGDGSWTFEGGLYQGPLNLLKFAAAFLGAPMPAWLAEDRFRVDLVEFWARYSTAAGNPYAVRGKLSVALQDTVIGIPMSLAAAASIERRAATGTQADLRAVEADGAMVTVGSVGGTFTVNRFAVGAAVSFGEREKTYTFSVSYDGVSLTAATSWTGTGDGRHQVLTVRLRGLTLGGIVRYFVNLANPNANFRLDPPWDFLDSIALDRFALVVDPTLQSIALTYDIDLVLPFLVLKTVGIQYDRASGNPSVKLVVEGNFLGDARYGDDALSWDPVTQAPPAVPGLGDRLFQLRYLGMGQHVTPRGLLEFDSISQVLDAMRATMTPVDGAPALGGDLVFDEQSQWLFGLDCTVMDTVTLKLVLHDPDLYGVLVSLAGPEAGSLAGLSFELMYKKVTADVGVFHARLQIPDAFRQLQFGVVAVTLGVITVDIYTNGNFRVDLGFPHNRDFKDSFAVEAGYFNGQGGIYFGLLDGATSRRVPAITNGTFSPVLELGVGLMVGVGRTFRKGPLNAGLYLNVLAIFEGTLGWFHPTDAGASTAMYYWCRGTAGLVGKLYGSVDFKVISVSVSVEAYATVTLTLAVYRQTLVELDVGVRVKASVKILFVKVSFSFSLELQASFTIGENSAAPWTLAADQSGRGQAQLAASAHAPSRRRPAHVADVTRGAYLAARFGAPAARVLAAQGPVRGAPEGSTPEGWHLAFDPEATVFPGGGTRTATLRLVPAFTVADVPVDWARTGTAPDNPAPRYRIAFTLTADSAVPPEAGTLAETHEPTVERNAHAQTAADTAFSQVAEAMLRWSLNALGVTSPTAQVTLGQLQELVDQLALPEAEAEGFTWTNLDGFLGGNLRFVVSGIPAGDTPATIGGVPFPMAPPLEWSTADLPPPDDQRQFWVYQPVDATYEAEVRQYFAPLDARDAAHQPDAQARLAAGVDEPAESMARFVFREFFLLTARAAAQAAVDALTAFPHPVQADDTLAGIAGRFPTTTVPYVVVPDDSVEHVAAVLGMSAAELLALDPALAATLAAAAPGDTIAVTVGVTPESIAAANPNWPVTAGTVVTLGDLAVPIAAGDTLASIAARYGVDADAWLATPALLDAPGIVRAGAPLPLPSFVYPNPGALPVEQVAAVYYVRLPVVPAGTPVPLADWYAEAIASLNGDRISHQGPLPTPLRVPSAYDDLTPAEWTPLPGDTLEAVAEYLALAQNAPAAGSPFGVWLAAVRAATPAAGPVTLPASAVATVAAGDTLRALATRLLTDAGSATFRALVRGADVLQPLADVVVPGARQAAPEGTTLVTLAQYHALALEDLAARAAGDAGLLALDPEQTLVVPGVPAMGLDALSAALHAGRPAATVAGQVSRYMMHGLRMPAPEEVDGVYHATGPMTGLYALTGQQVAGPAPSQGAVDEVVFSITFRKGEAAAWLTFADSATTEEGTTLVALESRYDALHDLNPALRTRAAEAHATLRAVDAGATPAAAAEVPLPAGMIVLTEAADALTLGLTRKQVDDGYPATGLVPAFRGAIRPLPLGRRVPVRYPVDQPIRWQTTVPPLLPAPAGATGTAVPTLWLLSGDLMRNAAGGASADAYRLAQATPQAGPGVAPTELDAYAWGMVVDLAVQRMPGSDGTVELFGADTAARQRLALLLDYLGVFPGSSAGDFPPPPEGEAVTLTLLWQLPSSSGAAAGLTSTALDPAASFVVKTNLSTETHSGRRNLRQRSAELDDPAPTPPPFASLAPADAPRFLALVWECSVVGGGGYWLHYQAPDGTPGIPDSIFDQDGRATLSLLVQLASQSTTSGAGWPVRTLFAFNDVAVVGDGVDPGSVALFAHSDDPADTTPEAAVQQGRVGFTLDLTAPGVSGAADDQQALQSLYSLIGYQLVETAAFLGSDEGQPLGPEVREGDDGTLDEDTWSLMRVIPITRFARTPAAPDVAGFPPPADDPYAGIATVRAGDAWQTAATEVELWFHDVLGNVSAPPPEGEGNDARVTVPVGYTDPLIGPGAWPATTLSYAVTAPPGGGDGTTAELGVAASMQAVVYQPGATEPVEAARARADRDRERYARIHYQVVQPDVRSGLLTSLQQSPAGEDGTETPPDLLPVGMEALRGYAAGSYVLLSTLARMGPHRPDGAPTLDAVASGYGVDYDAIGAANAGTPLGGLVATTALQVPQVAVYRTSDTVLALCGGSQALAEQVLQDPDNVVLPLQAGTELAIPPATRAVADPQATAAGLAQGFSCTVETLAAANAATPALLTPGFVFDCNGFTVTVAPSGDAADATLNGVAAAFQQQGQPYDAVAVVQMNAERPGMFRASASLSVAGYVAVAGDTLLANGAGAAPGTLAPLNVSTPALFADGAPLYLRSVAETLDPADTLGDAAAARGLTPGMLLRHNGGVATAGAFAVPGLYGWPADPSALRVPYTVRADETLETIAARFPLPGTGAAPAAALVQMNAAVPGTLAPGKTVEVDGRSAQTQAGDSFQAFAGRFAPPVSLEALTGAIYRSATILNGGALLVAPPATLPAATAPATALTPGEAAAPYGVSAAQLLAANAGTPGLLVPGVALAASTAPAAPTEITAAHDSVTAVMYRFQRRGVTTSIAGLAAANAEVPFVAAGASVLLPPADAVLRATLGGFDPEADDAPVDAPWKFPSAIFPIHVWVQLTRAWALVDADLRGTEASPAPAARARTAVPAARQGLPDDRTDGGAVTLTGFATSLERAVPPVRVATGKVLAEEERADPTDVWAVVFSGARIASVQVVPPVELPGIEPRQPRTFALRPLFNSLVARSGVELQTLDTSTGTLTGGEPVSFQGVDLEVWARSFLADVELVLSGSYAPGAYVVNSDALKTLVAAKRTLAAAVAGGLDYVLAGEAGAPPQKRAAAVESLRQQLLFSLSRGYAASAVLQYDGTATTPWSTEYARFSGASDITFGSQDPQLQLASVSNGKVSLRNGESELNLVVYVPDVEAHETLPMTLDFRLVEMEYGVATEIEGYDRSDWLTFVNPVETGLPPQVQVDLGSPTVPLPLRAYPPMPTLLDHEAQGPQSVSTVDDAVRWTYRFRLRHQTAAQDDVRLEVEMNRRPARSLRAAPAPDDLVGWLAQYDTVAVPLMGLLGPLQRWERIADPALTAAALGTFASLATSVATAWARHWGVPVSGGAQPRAQPGALVERSEAVPAALDATLAHGAAVPATETYTFTLTLQANEAVSRCQSLTLARTRADGTMGWPSITCYTPDGTPHVLEPGGDCGCAQGDADCRCYTFPITSDVPPFSLLEYELAFGDLHVADYQNAIATVWVTRNASFFSAGGPATAEAFVYQTPRSSYTEPVVPFISVADRLEIGTWSYLPAQSPLTPLFATLFDGAPADRTIAMGVRYGYQLAPGDPPLESYLPVVQSASVAYGDRTVADVGAALDVWYRHMLPVTAGGGWAFWIDMYSTVDPSLRRPVLQLKRLISPLE